MATPYGVRFLLLVEPLGGVPTNRLQHPEAHPGVTEETLVDQRLQRIQICVGHLLGSLERAAAAEDGEPSEQPLLILAKEIVAPLNRGPQRQLACVDASACPEQVKPSGEAVEELLGGEDAHAGCRELERERELLEPGAEFRHGGARGEPGLNGTRPGEEELGSVLGLEWGHRVRLLGRKAEQLPAGDEQMQVGAGGEQLGQPGGGLDDMLEVVEEQQQRLVGDMPGQAVLGPQRLPRGLQHQLRVAQRSKRHPEDAVRIPVRGLGSGLEAEPRLACTPRPGQCQ